MKNVIFIEMQIGYLLAVGFLVQHQANISNYEESDYQHCQHAQRERNAGILRVYKHSYIYNDLVHIKLF